MGFWRPNSSVGGDRARRSWSSSRAPHTWSSSRLAPTPSTPPVSSGPSRSLLGFSVSRGASAAPALSPTGRSRGRSAPEGAGEPNPYRYHIERSEEIHGHLLLQVRYPDCRNYEGRKILLFERGVTIHQLINQGFIDPHFLPQGIHPIARFEPTERGWQMAQRLAQAL